MLKSDFEKLVADAMTKRPIWFQLDREAPATPEQLTMLEAELGATLSPEFRDFLCTHGAGMFAFAKVLGPRADSDWAILGHARHLPADFVPLVDLETGDYYGQVVVDGRCSQEVGLWDHESESVKPTSYADFYSMMAIVALKPR